MIQRGLSGRGIKQQQKQWVMVNAKEILPMERPTWGCLHMLLVDMY